MATTCTRNPCWGVLAGALLLQYIPHTTYYTSCYNSVTHALRNAYRCPLHVVLLLLVPMLLQYRCCGHAAFAVLYSAPLLLLLLLLFLVTPCYCALSVCACSATGGHYNPNMAVTCVPSSPWSCEVGDLSGKHSKLNLAATPGTRSFYTDLLLPVTGAWSISNRSIVVHNAAGARIACATTVMTPRSVAPAPAPGGMGPAPAPAPLAPAPSPTVTPVKVSLTLSGVTLAVANMASVKTAITNTIASSIGVPASSVTITSITAARRLSIAIRRLSSSVVVAFEVAVADATKGTSVKNDFTKTSGSTSTFLTTLSSSLSSAISGASGTTVSISVTSASATGGTVPVPAPSDNDDGKKKGLSGGVVAIIVIIVIAVVGAGAFFGYQKMQGMDSASKEETAEKLQDDL